MKAYNPYQKYQSLTVNTLSSGELVVLLYDELALRMNKAVLCIENNSLSEAHRHIVRAEDIVTYLIESLDMRYPISQNLLKIYDFINRRLLKANIGKDRAVIEELLPLVNELRGAWKEADGIVRQKSRSAGGAV